MKSMLPPVELNPGEQVIRQVEATYLRTTYAGIGYNLLYGYFWLTNHRVQFQPIHRRRQLGIDFSPVAFPLSRLTEVTILPMKVQWSQRDVIRLTFDNRGREYFLLPGAPEDWQAVLLEAKAQAPDLPYGKPPRVHAGVEGARLRAWIFLGALVVGLPLCAMFSCLMLAALGELIGS